MRSILIIVTVANTFIVIIMTLIGWLESKIMKVKRDNPETDFQYGQDTVCFHQA
jgi:hypothetical protein